MDLKRADYFSDTQSYYFLLFQNLNTLVRVIQHESAILAADALQQSKPMDGETLASLFNRNETKIPLPCYQTLSLHSRDESRGLIW